MDSIYLICFLLFFVFQLWWKFSTEQCWMLWPCYWQLGCSYIYGHPAVWCWSLCTSGEVRAKTVKMGLIDLELCCCCLHSTGKCENGLFTVTIQIYAFPLPGLTETFTGKRCYTLGRKCLANVPQRPHELYSAAIRVSSGLSVDLNAKNNAGWNKGSSIQTHKVLIYHLSNVLWIF